MADFLLSLDSGEKFARYEMTEINEKVRIRPGLGGEGSLETVGPKEKRDVTASEKLLTELRNRQLLLEHLSREGLKDRSNINKLDEINRLKDALGETLSELETMLNSGEV